MNLKQRFIAPLLIFFVLTSFSLAAQDCPPNIGFENGTLDGWHARTGVVSNAGGVYSITWTSDDPDLTKHTVIGPNDRSLDFTGKFPRACPNGSRYSMVLGDDVDGFSAASISYTYTIPATATKFSILYQYALVFSNYNLSAENAEHFSARVVDVFTDAEIGCYSINYVASKDLRGFKKGARGGIYKEWTPVTLDLSAYAGRTIKLEFIVGYGLAEPRPVPPTHVIAYIDVNASCDGTLAPGFYCNGDPSVTLTAPAGFEHYQWYADDFFDSVIGSDQKLTLSPVPAIGHVYPVIVTPFDGEGCLDTLYSTVVSADKPVSVAGVDSTICSKSSIALGAEQQDGFLYKWSPGQLLVDSNIASPVTRINLPGPTNFVVRTTNNITGCFAFDTVKVTPVFLDTSSSGKGTLVSCPGVVSGVTLTVNNPANTAVWLNGNMAIPGATGLTFQPAGPGFYRAQIKSNGCIDTTRKYTVTALPAPVADFKPAVTTECINSAIFFKNNSTITGDEPLEYRWTLPGGLVSQSTDVTQNFPATGTFTIKLKVTSAEGCTDSTNKSVTILDNCAVYIPSAFTPNGDNVNDMIRPVLIGAKKLKRFAVFNRYGQIIYATAVNGEGWDGTLKGKQLGNGSYVWMLEYYDSYHHTIVERGTVTLIR